MKRKIVLSFLLVATVANLIILIIALTNKSGPLYDYGFIIGLSFLVLGGYLREHVSKYNKKT